MAGPGDEMAAATAACRQVGVSLADREQVIEVLKSAFVQGRLAKDEFDARIGHVLAAQTYADLAAVTADVPAGLAGAQPLRQGARVQSRRPVNRAVKWGANGLITPAIFAAAFVVAVLSGRDAIMGPALLTATTIAFPYFVFWLFVGVNLLGEWRKERSHRRPPVARSYGEVI